MDRNDINQPGQAPGPSNQPIEPGGAAGRESASGAPAPKRENSGQGPMAPDNDYAGGGAAGRESASDALAPKRENSGQGPVTLDEMEQMLDELAAELPEVFFRELNGGIVLLPQTERHPRGQGGLYTLGCYFSGGEMGRYIAIYYGSFLRVFPHALREEIRRELRKTLRHEFRHHVESLCGENGLEVEDEIFLQNYLRSRGGK